PLCRHSGSLRLRRWSRPVQFAGRRFDYLQCPRCRSLACTPMPDDALLEELYGTEYTGEPTAVQRSYDDWVLTVLTRCEGQRFIDYGCGEGRLLERVRATGWECAGVEYDDEVVALVRRRTAMT